MEKPYLKYLKQFKSKVFKIIKIQTWEGSKPKTFSHKTFPELLTKKRSDYTLKLKYTISTGYMYNRKLSKASPKDPDLATSPKTEDKEASNMPLKKKSSQQMEVESPSRLIKQSNSLMHTHTYTELCALNNYLYTQKHRGEEERSATRASLFGV